MSILDKIVWNLDHATNKLCMLGLGLQLTSVSVADYLIKAQVCLTQTPKMTEPIKIKNLIVKKLKA